MAVYINRSQAIAERLVKLRDYLYANASPTNAVKASEILAYLASERHEVEIKTLYKDLETLKNFFKLEIDYDKHQKGYILKNPQFEPYELRMIVNSIQAAKFITQQEADKLTDKVMRLADKHTRPSLNRRTFVKNRIRSINEDIMRGLDIIYEAIAQDRKISYRYFNYTLSGYNRSKEYRSENGSKTIIASPYAVFWDDDGFSLLSVQTITLNTDDMEYFDDADETDDEEYITYVEEPEPEEKEAVICCYDELKYMEQIKILPDGREGKDIAQKEIEKEKRIDAEKSLERTRLKVSNMYISDVIDRFGNNVIISPMDNEYFIATINGAPSPELYMWTRTFFPLIEIISPMGAEAKLQRYFLDISKGNYVMPSIIYDIHYLNLDQEEVDEPFSD